jgi:hypothetical protein
MRLRTWVTGAVVAGFLFAGVPALVHAQEHQDWGDYDEQHAWHSGDWWEDHHPEWVKKHHPEWAEHGDWDEHHHWRDREWWKRHHAKWARKHHPGWF